MNGEQQQLYSKPALDKFRQWHFWWLVVFSLFLVVTFIWYLPTRFLYQLGTEAPLQEHMEQGMTGEKMKKHMEEEHEDGMMQGEHKMEDSRMMPAHQSLGDGGMDEHEESGGHEEEGHEAIYFEENTVKQGLAVNLNINPVPYNVGVPLSMDFFVNQKPSNMPVLANQLQVEHEKLMHVIGVRSDMNEFFHLHPEFLVDNPSIFSVGHTFNKPGFYKIWSEIKKDGVNYSFGHPDINVNGPGLKEDKKIYFSRNVIAGNYQISLETSDTVVKGREVDFTFDIHSLTGMEVKVEQYLGADMHLSIIKDDRSRFIHTHPVRSHARAPGASPEDLGEATSYGTHPEEEKGNHNHSLAPWLINVVLAHGGVEDEPTGATDEYQTAPGGDEVINFQITLPEVGLYKAFVQFRPQGIDLPVNEALLAEFWIQVEEKAAFPISQWWGLLLVSVILIAGLGWVVKKYLKVRSEDIQIKK